MNNITSQVVFVIKTEFDGSLSELADSLSLGMKLSLNKDVRCILRDSASEEHSTTLFLNTDKFAKAACTKLKHHLMLHSAEVNMKKLEQEHAQREAELRSRREFIESMRKQLEDNDLSDSSVAQRNSPSRDVSPVRDEDSVRRQRDASPQRTKQDVFAVPDDASLSQYDKDDIDNSDESHVESESEESGSDDADSLVEEIKKTPRNLRPSTVAPRPTRKRRQPDRHNPAMPEDHSTPIRVTRKGTLKVEYRKEFQTFLTETFDEIGDEHDFMRLFDEVAFFQHLLSVMKRCWIRGIENRKNPGYFTEASLRLFIQQSFSGCNAGTGNCSMKGTCAACGQTKPLSIVFIPDQSDPSECYRLGGCCGAAIEQVILCLNKLTNVLDKLRTDGGPSVSQHSCVKSFYEAVAILEEHGLE